MCTPEPTSNIAALIVKQERQEGEHSEVARRYCLSCDTNVCVHGGALIVGRQRTLYGCAEWRATAFALV